MSDYKTLYYKLFNAVTDAITLLQEAQLQTEELFVSEEDMDSEDEEN